MTLDEIKDAVRHGKHVFWQSPSYEVRRFFVKGRSLGKSFCNPDQGMVYRICCKCTDHMIGLTHADEVTLNGKEEDFYIGEKVSDDQKSAEL